MSTYAISDIHGHKAALAEMLDKIGFTDDDELFILGDIIDKGAESAELLVWAVDEAPENVHFLLGNHEDLAYGVMKRDPEDLEMDHDVPWYYNGGAYTAERLWEITSPEWRAEKMLPWLESLPLSYMVEAGGRRFLLVHAGVDPSRYEGRDPGWSVHHVHTDANPDPLGRHELVALGNGFGDQYSQDLLWSRDNWFYDKHPAPCDVVFGHTYIRGSQMDNIRRKADPEAFGGDGRIAHFLNKHGIDCGCAYDDSDGCRCALACLRLDDMSEFYVDLGGRCDPFDFDAIDFGF